MSTPSPDLGKVINSAYARRLIYSVYVVAILILGAFQVGFAASSAGIQPALTMPLDVGVRPGSMSSRGGRPGIDRSGAPTLCAPGGNRTRTRAGLSRLPLPIGPRGRGADGRGPPAGSRA